jgi:hypothetical protein
MAKLKVLFVGRNANQGLKESDSTSIHSVAILAGHSVARDLSEKPDIVICVDWCKSAGQQLREARNRGIPSVLVKNEPSIVIPAHDDIRVDSKFDSVLEVGRPLAEIPIRWPQTWNTNYFDNSKRLDQTVAMSANKFSFTTGELYSLRAKAYAEMQSVVLFGSGWNRPLFIDLLKLAKEFQITVLAAPRKLTSSCIGNLRIRPRNFLGPAKDKLETISRYKVSLVIENSAEFMSEKLIDSILAGTIPVYVGPPVEMFGIPKELVVSAEPNVLSVQAALAKAHGMRHKQWQMRAKKWILEPGVKESWDSQNVFRLILETAELAVKRDRYDSSGSAKKLKSPLEHI